MNLNSGEVNQRQSQSRSIHGLETNRRNLLSLFSCDLLDRIARPTRARKKAALTDRPLTVRLLALDLRVSLQRVRDGQLAETRRERSREHALDVAVHDSR